MGGIRLEWICVGYVPVIWWCCSDVFVLVWWCFCGGVLVVLFLRRCLCGGACVTNHKKNTQSL